VKLPLTAIWVVHLKPLLKHFAPGGIRKRLVELFTWEKLDFVDQVKAALDCSSIHNKIENQLN
jgi:hypothetical protein